MATCAQGGGDGLPDLGTEERAAEQGEVAHRAAASRRSDSSRAGEVNRARVLKTLYANGPLARPELARLTGSTRATIGQIVTSQKPAVIAEIKDHFESLCAEFAGPGGVLSLPHAALMAHGRA